MVQKKFKRTNFANYSKLGVRRKNKQKYRKGKGLDNKMRLNMKGHLRRVKVGFRTAKKTRDFVKELKPIKVNNIEDLKKIKEGMVGIISRIGNKKKHEVLDYAIKNNIKINLDAKKELLKIDEKLKQSKEEKTKRKERRILRDKKAQKEAEKKIKQEEKKKEAEEKKEKTVPENKDPEKMKNGKKPLTNNYGRGK
jgi:large subunit ribosomal protein L32e